MTLMHLSRAASVAFLLLVLVGAALVPGCPKPPPSSTTAPPAPRPGEQRLTMDPIQIVATPTEGGFKTESFTAEELFGEGFTAQKKSDCPTAIAAYRKLLRFFAKSPYSPAVHYNLGLCLQHTGEHASAGTHFEAAAGASIKPLEQIVALGAAGVNYADAGQWTDSARCFDKLRRREELTTAQRIESETRFGLAWFKTRSFSKAQEAFRNALRIHRETRDDERLPSLFYVAMAAYHMAAIYHEMFSQSPIRLPASQMQKDVEDKATWLYKAQQSYWAVLKYKEHFWSMAAVFQVGSLYAEFRRALLDAPHPRFYDVRYFDGELKRYELITRAEQREEYYTKLRDKTRVLLQHAMTVYRKGLVTAERIGATNEWVKRMQRAHDDTKEAFQKDPDGGAPTAGTTRRRPGPREPLLPEALDPARYRPMAVEL